MTVLGRRNAVDCVGAFGAYGSCSKTCGSGTQTRTYAVTTPAARGGSACPHAHGFEEQRACSIRRCPAPPRGNCFPPHATVDVEGAGATRLDQVAVGDRVLTLDAAGVATFSPVVMFMDKDDRVTLDYLRIGLDDGSSVEMTPKHKIYKDAAGDGSWCSRASWRSGTACTWCGAPGLARPAPACQRGC